MEELAEYGKQINELYGKIRYSPEKRRAFYVYITDKYFLNTTQDPATMVLYRYAEAIGRKSRMDDTSIASPIPSPEEYSLYSYIDDKENNVELEKVFKLFVSELQTFN